jgi:hypothetical protein
MDVHCEPALYFQELNRLRGHLSGNRSGFMEISLYPPGKSQPVKLWMRCSDLYIVGFKGASRWYFLEENVSGPADAGKKKFAPKTLNIGTNYNNLTKVGAVTVSDLGGIGSLGEFDKDDQLDERAFVLAAAVVSEALRFATVQTYFTGLINGVIPRVDISQLNKRYFTEWNKMSEAGNADVLLVKS